MKLKKPTKNEWALFWCFVTLAVLLYRLPGVASNAWDSVLILIRDGRAALGK